MADDEKILQNALQTVFKSAKIPAELYEKRTHELKIDENEVVKVNMTLKRGLVLDIDDDSHFRTFLKYLIPINVNDIVLTVNDKVAAKPDFKLHDMFKERGSKTFVFTYVRMRCATDDRVRVTLQQATDYGSRYCSRQSRTLSAAMAMATTSSCSSTFNASPWASSCSPSKDPSKVMVMDVAAKTIGAMCMQPGDCILQINGARQGSDAARTLETIATEIEQKGFARITVERPMSEVARATALFTIQARVVARVVVVVVGELCCATRGTVCLSVSLNSLYSPASSWLDYFGFSISANTENRDLPIPADCAAYVKDALKLLKGGEPKSIMKSRSSGSDEAHVGFHERIHAESVIPSDIEDERLVKTPNRVPGVTVQPISLPAPPSESEKAPSAVKPPSVHAPPVPPPPPTTPPPAKEPKKSKVSKKTGTGTDSKNSKGRKRPSAEPIGEKKGSGKKTPASGAPSGKDGGASKSKTKKKVEGSRRSLSGSSRRSTKRVANQEVGSRTPQQHGDRRRHGGHRYVSYDDTLLVTSKSTTNLASICDKN
ncbi:hypothetical protein PRIPAC_73150 [Pristionchus pacificus]|uniref:Uncharacterized protein n=1 Tax=Pristionchus pacificus TaxID=54126 RepID=A0A2A6BRG9_PRIPA|nr:hypothetical protein PRIPAC_73150 [Pristionchus pacificus]|eukprot:PDM68552.1 hypothetical protein PRIPAC_44054 [Pristionchus pacificus]